MLSKRYEQHQQCGVFNTQLPLEGSLFRVVKSPGPWLYAADLFGHAVGLFRSRYLFEYIVYRKVGQTYRDSVLLARSSTLNPKL